MATYAELAAIQSNAGWGALVEKVAVACAVKAHAVITATTPPATRLAWARSTLVDLRSAANQIVFFAVAASKDSAVATILSANDGAIQSAVNAAVDAMYAE